MRILLIAVLAAAVVALAQPVPETVHFLSADGKTKLLGYLYRPSVPAPYPAVVLLHGRGGPYSSVAKGVFNAKTLSKRHKFWGAFWAGQGYAALLVDSFGPRGFPEGFGRGSYEDRPAAVSEQTVRPLDAYGALDFLRRRREVIGDRIGLQGWSNGGMTALVTMSTKAPGSGFRAALAFYPGCGMEAIQGVYVPYAPLHLFVGLADEEVSPQRCQKWETAVAKRSKLIGLTAYQGAEHNFDDPGAAKQKNPANAAANDDARRRAEGFFRRHLLGR
ncbi:MAG: dienelactone hydrolase family protein [Acidobacteria bacterium]|nr:dienelactone hydrolase family protein [Acidobacteriota bacterium]